MKQFIKKVSGLFVTLAAIGGVTINSAKALGEQQYVFNLQSSASDSGSNNQENPNNNVIRAVPVLRRNLLRVRNIINIEDSIVFPSSGREFTRQRSQEFEREVIRPDNLYDLISLVSLLNHDYSTSVVSNLTHVHNIDNTNAPRLLDSITRENPLVIKVNVSIGKVIEVIDSDSSATAVGNPYCVTLETSRSVDNLSDILDLQNSLCNFCASHGMVTLSDILRLMEQFPELTRQR